MHGVLLAFSIGVMTTLVLPLLEGVLLVMAVCCAALLLSMDRRPAVLWLAVFLLGWSWGSWHGQLVLAQRLAPEHDGQVRWLEGRVSGLPQWSVSAQGQPVVRFELEGAHSRRGALPSRMRFSWHNPPPLQAGEHWRLAVHLKAPDGLRNPHSFDYGRWLIARKLGATGAVQAGERVMEGAGLQALRERLRQRLVQLLGESEVSGALVALVLGDGSGVSRARWQLLQDSGTVHLFVISGQHVSLVAGLVYGGLALLVRLGLWPMRLPWLPFACGAAFVTALGYGALAGFGVPVRRAIIMLAVVLLWRMRYQSLASWRPWLLALALVLLLDPLAVLQPGFWLSFAAVAVLALVFAGRLQRWSGWQLLMRAQWAAAVGLLPLLLVSGLPVSFVGPLANALAVPFVSFWVLPLALLGSLLLPWPSLAAPVLLVAGRSLQGLWSVLEWLVQGWPAWQAALPSLWVMLLVALAAWLLLLPSALRPLWLVVCLLAPLLWPADLTVPAVGRAQVWLLDVGQGQAIVVRTARHVLLYDAGPAMGDKDAGASVVVPFLRGERISRVDRMLLSHADADHAGGALSVLQQVMVSEVVSGEPHRHQEFVANACEEHAWQWDGVNFWQWQWAQAEGSNAASCVLLVEAAGERFLVTGDLDLEGERALLAHRPQLRADWLVAGHHGSKTSSGWFWLEQLNPHSVLVSRGRYNSYGHPHPLVRARISRQGRQLFDTAMDKAMRIELGSRQTLWRMAQEGRWWHRQQDMASMQK